MTHLRKPEWLKTEKGKSQCGKVSRTLESYQLNSVCQQAACPNQGECFKSGTATFMLLGKNCTRNCTFCNVTKAEPEAADKTEPERAARAAAAMNLRHVVITSVTRDDLSDGGASHFAETIRAVREKIPGTIVEVLIPDFKGDKNALKTVLDAAPDILNHNVETVSELYSAVRPEAVFKRSIELIKRVHTMSDGIYSKSGFMVGLGETEEQVKELIVTLKDAGCDILTIGQYLQPSLKHYNVYEYIHPDQFQEYKEFAHRVGISCVSSGPLVRSSYHAEKDFMILKSGGYVSVEE